MITIYDNKGNVRHITPINKGCKRKFMLMQEDYILLKFSTDTIIDFRVGDYISFSIPLKVFGETFYITSPVVPTYNEKTAGYDYEIKFHAYYWMLNNRILRYSPSTGAMESSFTIAGSLSDHLTVIRDNIKQYYISLGYENSFTFDFNAPTEYTNTNIVINYSNVGIIDALNLIANETELEWWFGLWDDKCFNFGKLQKDDSEIVLSEDIPLNILPIKVTENNQSNVTRIFPFGSTQNLTNRYRRGLYFKFNSFASRTFTDGSPFGDSGSITYDLYQDATKPLYYEDFLDSKNIYSDAVTHDFEEYSDGSNPEQINLSFYMSEGIYVMRFPQITVRHMAVLGVLTYNFTVVYYDSNGEHNYTVAKRQANNLDELNIDSFTFAIPANGNVSIRISADGAGVEGIECYGTFIYRKLQYIKTTINHTWSPDNLSVEEKTFDVYLYPIRKSGLFETKRHWELHVYSKNSLATDRKSKTEINGLIRGLLPEGYFSESTSDYAFGIYDKNLRLPEGTDYVDVYDGKDEIEVVEEVKVWDDIFPEIKGTVNTSEPIIEKDDDGEEITYYHVYSTNIPNLDGKYLIDGQDLQLNFSSGSLNGMTFVAEIVDTSEDGTTFRIIPNENYGGTTLPNSLMSPDTNDEFNLFGMDVSYFDSEILLDAERRLLKRANEYITELKENASSYELTIMNDFAYGLRSEYKWREESYDDGYSVVLIEVGQAIKLRSQRLFGEYEATKRVIGYEMNLDIPYDKAKFYLGGKQIGRISAVESKLESLSSKIGAYKGGNASSGKGQSIYIITSEDAAKPSDNNVYSAKKVDTEFLAKEDAISSYLSKTANDTAKGIITFLQGIKIGSWEGENTAHSFQLWYDETLDSVVLSRTDGKPAHFLATGALSTRGLGNTEEGGTGGGMDHVYNVDDFSKALDTFNKVSETDTFNAYAIRSLYEMVKNIENSSTDTSYVDGKIEEVNKKIDTNTAYLSEWIRRTEETLQGNIDAVESVLQENIDTVAGDLSSLQTTVNDFLTGTDTDTIINRWKELEAFLAGYTETATLADLLSGKADKATTLSGYGITNAYTKTEVDNKIISVNTSVTTLQTTVSGHTTSINSLQSTVSGHTSSITSINSKITTLQGYFTDGVAKSALRLSDGAEYKAWGQVFFRDGKPVNVSGEVNADSVLFKGKARLSYDSTLNALLLTKDDGTVVHFLASGAVATRGLGELDESGGSGTGVNLLSVPSDIIPSVGDTYSLGASGTPWKELFVGDIQSGNILPLSHYTYSLGADDNRWSKIYGVDIYATRFTMNGEPVATKNWVNSQSFAKASELTTINNSITALQASTFTGANAPEGEGYTLTWFTQSGGARNVTIPAYGELADGLSGIGQNVALVDQWLISDLINYINDAVTGGSVDLTSVASDIIPDGNLTRKLGSSSNRWSSLYVNSIIAGTIAPRTDNGWDLGMTTFRWKNLYAVDGHLDNLSVGGYTINVTTSVASGNTSLVTSGGVYTALQNNVVSGGKLNLSSITTTELASIMSSLGDNGIKFYIVTDSSGNIPSLKGETSITVSGAAKLLLFGKSSPFGVNVGDILAVTKLTCKIIPLNDAKAASGDFPGADGLETVWDKTQINKIAGIESTANAALPKVSALPSKWESNMNNALETGVYVWCTLGRPAGSTGAYTCVVLRTSTNDGNYDTIEQTAYGREAELGQVYKRIIFYRSDGTDTQYGEWRRVDNSGSFSTITANTLASATNNDVKIDLKDEDVEITAGGWIALLGDTYFGDVNNDHYVYYNGAARLKSLTLTDGLITPSINGVGITGSTSDGISILTVDGEIHSEYICYFDEIEVATGIGHDKWYIGNDGDMTIQLINGYKPLTLGNTSFSPALTSGTVIGTITIGGESKTIYAPSGESVDLSNYVTLDGEQTITGNKTFTDINANRIFLQGFELTPYNPDGGTPDRLMYDGYVLLDEYNYSEYLDSAYVKKSGDTVTGQLRFTGSAYPHIFGNGSVLVLSGSSATNQLVLDYVNKSVRPSGANAQSLGNSANRWSNVYSVLGNFSGQITSSVADGTAPLVVASKTEVANLNTMYHGGLAMLKFGFPYKSKETITDTTNAIWYAKVTFKTGWNHNLHKIYIDASYNNINGKVLLDVDGYSHSRGNYTVKSSNYNGNNVIGFHWGMTSDNINILYLKLKGGSSATTTVYSTLEINAIEVVDAESVPALISLSSNGGEIWTNYNINANIKFSTPRTLWGHPFDGSSNISGSLSGVTTITGVSGTDLVLTNNGNIQFKYNDNNASSVVLNYTQFKPFDAANGLLDLGATSARWKGIYGQTLDLGGHIYLPNYGTIYAKDTSGSNIGLLCFSNINNLLIGQAVARAGYNTNIYGNTISLGYGTAGSTSNTALFVNSDGNVGIGTTSPAYKFDVNGTFHASGNATFDSSVFIGGLRLRKSNSALLVDTGATANNAVKASVMQVNTAGVADDIDWAFGVISQGLTAVNTVGSGVGIVLGGYSSGSFTFGRGSGIASVVEDLWYNLSGLAFYVNHNSSVTTDSFTEKLRLTSQGNLIPKYNTSTQSLGSSSARWVAYLNSVDISGNATIGGTLTVNGVGITGATTDGVNQLTIDGEIHSDYICWFDEIEVATGIGSDKWSIYDGEASFMSIQSGNVLPKSNRSGSIGSSSLMWLNGYINNLYSDVIYTDTLTSRTAPYLSVETSSLDLMSCELYGYDSDGNANWNIASNGIASFNSVIINSNDHFHSINGNADGELVIWPSEYLVIENDTITDYSITCRELVQTSDIRYKNIKENVHLKLSDIAAAPTFKFSWANDTDGSTHIGTSAQYWQGIAGELVVANKKTGKLGLDYSTAALVSAVSIAREVNTIKMWQTTTTDRIGELEDKVKKLEEENKVLRELLNNK